jgi:hypothetical protein
MRFLLAFFFAVFASATILPENIGPYQRTATAQPNLTDRALWDEYGLKESETGTYEGANAKFTVTAWRLQDTTGALAAYDWQRPAGSKPSELAPLSAETAHSVLLVEGNYLLSFAGYKPELPELAALADSLKNVDTSALPTLPSFLPSDNLIAASERYITGPVALQKFAADIPPSVAGFHYGAEAQLGVFHGANGDATLAIFDYPTPQIAMQKIADFEKLGKPAKRSGPLIAVVLSSLDPDFAERLLAEVRYQAQVTRSEYVPTRRDNLGELLLNIVILIGILLLFSAVSGLAVGGVRTFLRRSGRGHEAEAMISLHLEQR